MQYKTETWNNGSRWYVGDCRELHKGSNEWYIPCRLLNKTPKEFAEMMIVEYNARVHLCESNLLLYTFSNENDALKFQHFINNKAKGINFQLV